MVPTCNSYVLIVDSRNFVSSVLHKHAPADNPVESEPIDLDARVSRQNKCPKEKGSKFVVN